RGIAVVGGVAAGGRRGVGAAVRVGAAVGAEPPALLFAELVESPSGSEFAVPAASDPSLSSVSQSEPPEALLFALSLRSGYFSPLAMMVCPSEVKVHLGLGPPSGKFSNSIGSSPPAGMISPSSLNSKLLGAAAVSVASATDRPLSSVSESLAADRVVSSPVESRES